MKKLVRDLGQEPKKREKKWCGTWARSRKNEKKLVRDPGHHAIVTL